MVYKGEAAFVSFDLTRWNERAIQLVSDWPYITGARTNPGVWTINEYGSLMITDGLALSLYVIFAHRNRPSMNDGANAMPAGYRFPGNIIPIGPFVRRNGNKANKYHCVFQAIPRYDEPSATMILYDSDIRAAVNVGLN